MNKLQKVKEALDSIIERENVRIEPLVAAGKFPVDQSVRVIAKEAHTYCNHSWRAPKTKALLDGLKAQAAINVIKGN